MLDEADRMLDMGFIHDINWCSSWCPEEAEPAVLATFSDEITGWPTACSTSPSAIEVARRNATAELVAQKVHRSARAQEDLLTHLIKSGDWHQVLVFTRMKHGANRAGRIPERRPGISAMAIHGNKSQTARTKALADFKTGELRPWWPPTSPRAASTSTSCRTSSTSSCPTCRKTDTIASAAPIPEPRVAWAWLC